MKKGWSRLLPVALCALLVVGLVCTMGVAGVGLAAPVAVDLTREDLAQKAFDSTSESAAVGYDYTVESSGVVAYNPEDYPRGTLVIEHGKMQWVEKRDISEGTNVIRLVKSNGVQALKRGGGMLGTSIIGNPYAIFVCGCGQSHSEDCLKAAEALQKELGSDVTVIHVSSDVINAITVDENFGFFGVYGDTSGVTVRYVQCTGGCGAKNVNHERLACGHCAEYGNKNCAKICTHCKKYMCNLVSHGPCPDCHMPMCVATHADAHLLWTVALLDVPYGTREDDAPIKLEAAACAHSWTWVDGPNGSVFICSKCGKTQ